MSPRMNTEWHGAAQPHPQGSTRGSRVKSGGSPDLSGRAGGENNLERQLTLARFSTFWRAAGMDSRAGCAPHFISV